MHDFDEGDDSARRKLGRRVLKASRAEGYFHTLPQAERRAAVCAAMEVSASARAEVRQDLAEQQEYFVLLEREQASQKQLDRL
eukprot:2203819-Pleurochrysis_carterae.AAC.1